MQAKSRDAFIHDIMQLASSPVDFLCAHPLCMNTDARRSETTLRICIPIYAKRQGTLTHLITNQILITGHRHHAANLYMIKTMYAESPKSSCPWFYRLSRCDVADLTVRWSRRIYSGASIECIRPYCQPPSRRRLP